tara:strand:- start:1670 stop:1837 length:168 start_codon:yes stop_codon:yes gene_type:complete
MAINYKTEDVTRIKEYGKRCRLMKALRSFKYEKLNTASLEYLLRIATSDENLIGE